MAKIVRFITAVLICFSSLFFAQSERPDRGLPPVALVSHESGKWIIAGKKNIVTLSQADLAISVKAGDTTWRLRPSGHKDALVKSGGSEFFLRLADAGAITVEPHAPGYKSGVKLTLRDWP